MINTFLTALIKRIASSIKTIGQNDHLILLVLLALDYLNWPPFQHRRQRASSVHALQISHPRIRKWLFQLTFSTRPLYSAHVPPTTRHLFPAGIMRFVQIQFLAENKLLIGTTYPRWDNHNASWKRNPWHSPHFFTSLIYFFLPICKFISILCIFHITCGPSW